jgi:UDP-3-O-[3-hydroxymyristoyl] N-acetylglucosamine deacetylase
MARRRKGAQTTLKNRATLSGVGVHSGREVSVTLLPAEAGCGVSFSRTDLDNGRDREIPADFRYVNATDLSTSIGIEDASVTTIEHLMAALRALDIDNCAVEIDGPEVPVMDGSADAFIDAIDQAGIETLSESRRYIQIEKPIRVEHGKSVAEFLPHDGQRIEVEIDFANPLVGQQSYAFDVCGEVFRKEIGRARTFGFYADVKSLWARGFALGASLDNTIVIAEDRVMNPEGLRFGDEFVRHKALDAIGDLALAGAPILGCYRSHRGGHRLNHMALSALLAERDAWRYVEMDDVPARRESGHADLPAGVAAAAFGPDVS